MTAGWNRAESAPSPTHAPGAHPLADDTPTLRDAEEAYEAGDIETTLAICDGIIGEDEDSAEPEVLYLAGECLLEMQEPEEALRLFTAALKQDGENPLLMHCKGLCLFELGRSKEAKPLFEAARAASDELAEPVYYLGVLAERAGQDARAKELFAAAADLDPENFVAPTEWSEADVRSAFAELVVEVPEPFGSWLAGLPIEVRDFPKDDLLRRDESTISPLVHCIFLGEPSDGPQGEDPAGWLSATPDSVLLFRKNLGKSASDTFELQQEVLEALLWEAMEFLGLDEDALVTLGVLEVEEDDGDGGDDDGGDDEA